MSFVLASSAGLILLVIFCFGYTIYTILRQKKLSDMKTDFINNMTHEFKTPVATITLASEALKDPSLVADKERMQRLASIIYDENKRIGSHVERVLQLAAMEKGSFKLNPVEVDMHRLINNVVESVSLQVEAHGGQITCKLDAINPLFKADELHFSNVLYNLLDNAIKYCKEAPEVQISTCNLNGQLVVTIDDNGIGLTKEQQARVFEQFYRVPTGNLHDVKGFGLGLHYVKSVVEMHGGTVRVKSNKDKGSSFEIVLNQ
jgi:two-component system phosphate regulon sensor histidine kinase PhoR